eukprot:m.299798 g.299798  ORF g.299798 m.299798 type:complete len:361 (-) comp14248_c0_seq1:493-1575(-)
MLPVVFPSLGAGGVSVLVLRHVLDARDGSSAQHKVRGRDNKQHHVAHSACLRAFLVVTSDSLKCVSDDATNRRGNKLWKDQCLMPNCQVTRKAPVLAQHIKCHGKVDRQKASIAEPKEEQKDGNAIKAPQNCQHACCTAHEGRGSQCENLAATIQPITEVACQICTRRSSNQKRDDGNRSAGFGRHVVRQLDHVGQKVLQVEEDCSKAHLDEKARHENPAKITIFEWCKVTLHSSGHADVALSANRWALVGRYGHKQHRDGHNDGAQAIHPCDTKGRVVHASSSAHCIACNGDKTEDAGIETSLRWRAAVGHKPLVWDRNQLKAERCAHKHGGKHANAAVELKCLWCLRCRCCGGDIVAV